MKHLTDEHKKIWDKYYSKLNADQLMEAVIDSYIFVHSLKPGLYSYHIRKAPGLNYRGLTFIPGAIWHSQSKHQQVPEPKEKHIQELMNRYENNEITMLITQHSRGERTYSYYHEDQPEPLTAYLTYHPLILKRIYELTEPLLYGQREDVESLVSEYQAGNKDLLQRIENQLGGIINRAEKQFSFIGNKEAFTNLDGKFNKKIPKPEKNYSNISPAGDTEDQRLMLITEPFNFTEEDRQQVVNRALLQALESYRPNKGAKFKTWFYKILHTDLIDLYREYQRGWKHGNKVKTFSEFQEVLQGSNKINNHSFTSIIIEYRQRLKRINSWQDNLNEYLQPGFIEQLTLNQREWIKQFFDILPYILRANVTAEKLSINIRTEHRRRESLQKLFIKNKHIFKNYKITRFIEKDQGPAVRKWPLQTAEQKTRIDNYNKFINNGKPFPVIKNVRLNRIT